LPYLVLKVGEAEGGSWWNLFEFIVVGKNEVRTSKV
jgi:hypothetical protein